MNKTIKQLLNEANEIRDEQEMEGFELVESTGEYLVYSANSFVSNHPRDFLEKFIAEHIAGTDPEPGNLDALLDACKEVEKIEKQMDQDLREEPAYKNDPGYQEGMRKVVRLSVITQAEIAIKKMEWRKEQYKEAAEELEAALKELEPGEHFQDAEGVVYQIVKPTKQVVVCYYKERDYLRTRTAEEKAAKIPGKLSLTKARELGYVVEGKGPKDGQ